MKFVKISIILSFLISVGFSSHSEIFPKDAAKAAVYEKLEMPDPDSDGRIQTLNKKGAMSPDLDAMSREFVTFAALPNIKVLEIGAGYGHACQEALKQGSCNYHVNDMDLRHLKILARRIEIFNKDYLSFIHLIPGAFSSALNLSEDEYDAILIARVLHFMTPVEVSETLNQAYKILKPGGCIYAVMLSPYVKGYASFIPEFERRIQNNQPFPGYVENLTHYIDCNIVPETNQKNMTDNFLFFNVKTANDSFEQAGFFVEKAVNMPLTYPSKIWQLDGRENIGVMARKPKIN